MLGSRVNGSVDYECACAVNQMQMRAEQCGAGQDVGCACCPGRVMPLGWAHRASDRGLLGLVLRQLPLLPGPPWTSTSSHPAPPAWPSSVRSTKPGVCEIYSLAQTYKPYKETHGTEAKPDFVNSQQAFDCTATNAAVCLKMIHCSKTALHNCSHTSGHLLCDFHSHTQAVSGQHITSR